MPDINFTKNVAKFPFWQSGNGTLTVHLTAASPNQPLPPTDNDLLSLSFGVAGNEPFSFGAANTVKLGIKAGMNANLTPLWPTSNPQRLALLAGHGLDNYFATHPDDLILALRLGATADANLAGSFAYSMLQMTATLEAGGNAGYSYYRAYPRDLPILAMLEDFLGGLRLPANVTTVPQPGEVIAFEYGGYLNLSAGLSAGYELKGAPSFDLARLQLSEHYQLSVIGKLALGAKIAGNFAVEVRAAAANGQLLQEWAQVIVTKKRSRQFSLAADVSVSALSDLQGLPDSGDEFLGALLGVNVKNWLNVMARVRQLSDLEALKTELDDLAKHFLSEWSGKVFAQLSHTDFNTFLQAVEKVVNSYQNLDNWAITLFDRYYDKTADKVGEVLINKLNELIALTSWDNLKGEMDGELWNIVRQLTDGDPLGWMLGTITRNDANGQPTTIPSLPELKSRAQKTLELMQSAAHDEIRKVIALAKSQFPLDGLLNDLQAVDSIPKLQAIANQKLGAFVERLIGKTLEQMSSSDLGKTVTQLHTILEAAQQFEGKLYDKLKEAAHQSFSFNLHAEYSRASESEALIDVMINLTTDAGKALLRAAGQGDFQNILASYQPDLVKINRGILTHKVTKSSVFAINVMGWHEGWHYQGLDRVILNTAQQIQAEDNGALTIFTTLEMTKEKERRRNGERMYTNFLLRFLGESRGVLNFDAKNQQYLMDAITGMAASYQLSFDDPQTKREELEYYLSFAADFGLAAQGATLDALLPLLPLKAPNDYGRITTSYEVRYTEAGLRELFTTPFDERIIRQITRKIVLTNYLRQSELANIGWCYWTQGIYDQWKQGQAQFTKHLTPVKFEPVQASPYARIAAPGSATLRPDQLQVLSTLFFIEDDLVAGLGKLDALIQSATPVSPHDFEKALGHIGRALQQFDDFDEGVNTVFAVFDQYIKLHTAVQQVRASSLKLVSQVGTQEVTKVFVE
ncbi:MAG: hypothetical protein HY231_24510 [Acidobacteria bacterium]|nr:hypothetical protein [Acidobacteriota bacterium]